MKHALLTLILIFVSSIVTLNISSFSQPILLMTLPGLFFGFALTMPSVITPPKNYLLDLENILAYSVIWTISAGFSVYCQFSNAFIPDKMPFIIIAIFSGLGIGITFDWQFGFKNKLIGILAAITLSVSSILIGDYFFSGSNYQEINIGKQIAIWEILVGLGLLLNKRIEKNIEFKDK